jgi:PleD family two-component response regulator
VARVLVADDVAISREALARALRDRGHEVIAAADGEEALAAFQKEPPDAAVMDVVMQRISGLEAASRIKGMAGRHTPVILVSAKCDLEARLAALAVADDFLAKPYEPAELAARLESQLRLRRLIEEVRAGRAEAGALKSREQLLERLNEEWLRAVRFNEPLSVLVLQPDGPESPDALARLGEASHRVLRQIDVVARFPPNRICALLPNTHVAGALAAAARLKRELAHTVHAGMPLSACMGISVFPGREIAAQADLLRAAERAIARASDEGPGMICLYQHQGYLFQPE